MCTVPSPCIWARFGPAHVFGSDPAHFKEKNQKYLFQHFIIFSRSFYVIFINIGWYFMLLKIQKSDIKIPGFRQKLPKIQKNWKKRKKMFLCIRPSVSNLKNHIVFFICQKKNNILACILALITSLLKSREHWPKSQKQQKFNFFLF